MCGVIGYVGNKSCLELIYTALQKLEYRGYDSSGISVLSDGQIRLIKEKGKLENLKSQLSQLPKESSLGMGHTRWATHGVPSAANAHPHVNSTVSIVHNGILENYQELKIELLEDGVKFSSETDSEVIVHLLEKAIKDQGKIHPALLSVVNRLQGAYALGIMTSVDPEALYLVKDASPMVIGLGEKENYFASDTLALLAHTNKFIFLEDGELARLDKDKVEVWDFSGKKIKKKIHELDQSEVSIDKGGYRHYMLKEIHEQTSVFAQTIQRFVSWEKNEINLEGLNIEKLNLDSIKKIHIVACGTAFYAGLMGKYILEPKLQIPVDVELASEFRYRDSFVSSDTLFIAVTQSGETADTLASLKHAKSKGCQIYSICNVPFSSIPRESDGVLAMEAGPEIGVASTKAFTSMVLNFYILALGLGQKRKIISSEEIEKFLPQLQLLPQLTDQALSSDSLISDLTGKYFSVSHCLFIGRGLNFPIALEGALKLKEISYIHAEGYAAGELKHGPIALIDKNMPVVALAPKCGDYDKVLSNMEEIYAREGQIIGIGHGKDEKLKALCQHVIPCPQIEDPALQGILESILLQLFSYYMAVHRETDVDQPRNLAKSVTVE